MAVLFSSLFKTTMEKMTYYKSYELAPPKDPAKWIAVINQLSLDECKWKVVKWISPDHLFQDHDMIKGWDEGAFIDADGWFFHYQYAKYWMPLPEVKNE